MFFINFRTGGGDEMSQVSSSKFNMKSVGDKDAHYQLKQVCKKQQQFFTVEIAPSSLV